MAEPDANLGTRLRQCRERRQLSQNELARRSGVNVPAISRLESGLRTDTSSENLRKLADALGVSTDYLLGRTDREEFDPEETAAGMERGTTWAIPAGSS